jgi:predicted CoA-binding protein
MFENPGRDARCALLARVKNIAVVGLSPNPLRPSHGVSAAMQRFGYNVIPVHPAVKTVLGVRAYARLADIDQPVDLVNVFRQPEFVSGIVDECIALGLKALWLQDGVIDAAAADRARAAGMLVVMDRCIYRDYKNEYLPGSTPSPKP